MRINKYLYGYNKTGVFWQALGENLSTDFVYPRDRYFTPFGLAIPFSAQGHNLIRFLNKLADEGAKHDILKYLPTLSVTVGLTIFTYDGEIINIFGSENERNKKMYEINLYPLTLPETGWTIISPVEQELARGLTLISPKYKSYKNLLEFHNEHFVGKINPEKDVHYLSFAEIFKRKPPNAKILGCMQFLNKEED